jgi:uncharacterized protein
MSENSTPHTQRHRREPARDRIGEPGGPFAYDVRALGRRPGSMREVRRSAPATAALGSDVIGVPAGAPLVADVRLESVTEGVLVTGTVTAPVRGECGRCLEPITDELVVEVCELFAYPDSTTDETTGRDEVHRIEGDYLDLEPVVRDAVVLGLPWTPLCRPDCGGLCPDCGQRIDDLPAGHAHESIDPRWAVLAAFTTPDGSPGGASDETTKE